MYQFINDYPSFRENGLSHECQGVCHDENNAYFQMARQERTQDEKLQRNHVVSYDAMDNEGMVGAEAFRRS